MCECQENRWWCHSYSLNSFRFEFPRGYCLQPFLVWNRNGCLIELYFSSVSRINFDFMIQDAWFMHLRLPHVLLCAGGVQYFGNHSPLKNFVKTGLILLVPIVCLSPLTNINKSYFLRVEAKLSYHCVQTWVFHKICVPVVIRFVSFPELKLNIGSVRSLESICKQEKSVAFDIALALLVRVKSYQNWNNTILIYLGF